MPSQSIYLDDGKIFHINLQSILLRTYHIPCKNEFSDETVRFYLFDFIFVDLITLIFIRLKFDSSYDYVYLINFY